MGDVIQCILYKWAATTDHIITTNSEPYSLKTIHSVQYNYVVTNNAWETAELAQNDTVGAETQFMLFVHILVH
jgi:hypothetical protein